MTATVSPLSHEVREALRPPRKLTIDEWAEQTIHLPRATGATAGRIDFERTPYAREPLQMATDPDVEEITLCFAAQVAKTTIAQCVAFYYLVEDPWPCLHVMPREDDAVAINTDRYQAIIEESPTLRQLLSGAKHDMTRQAIHLGGNTLTFAGANSPAALASRAICCLVLDEVDKYPEFSGREADPVALARERTITFANRKILQTSTPTTMRGYIWQSFLAGDQRRYQVPCPHCGCRQVLVLGSGRAGDPGVKVPPEILGEPERIIDERAAWYECEACHERITDEDKPEMLRLGKWVPAKPGSIRRVSYHLSRLYAPWDNTTFSHVIAEFLRSRKRPEKLMNFRNSWLAEIWQDQLQELRGDELRARQGTYTQREVPEEAHIILGTVDVQQDHFWYALRAWGHGGRSWLVRCGQAPSWEYLVKIFERSYYQTVKTQQVVPVEGVVVDCGYRMDEVIQHCRRHPKWIPVKGSINLKRPLTSSLDKRGNRLVTIDTSYYKAKLHRLVRTEDDSPDAWHLPSDLTREYFEQMTAEQRVVEKDKATGKMRTRWKVLYDGAANHLFDAEVYQVVAAEIADVENRWTGPPVREKPERAPRMPEGGDAPSEGRRRGGPRFRKRRFPRLK